MSEESNPVGEGGDDRRYRGILTPGDREALGTSSESGSVDSDVSRRHARYRIRKRTKRAIHDLAFLFRYLPERDRRQIFAEFMNGPERDQFRRALELLILGVLDSDHAFDPPHGDDTDDPMRILEWFLGEAIGGAYWDLGYQSNVWVDIEVEWWRLDPEETFERVLAGYGDNVDLVYLSARCEHIDFKDYVIENDLSIRFVRGPASMFGSQCLQEFGPEDARCWKRLDDDSANGDESSGAALEHEE